MKPIYKFKSSTNKNDSVESATIKVVVTLAKLVAVGFLGIGTVQALAKVLIPEETPFHKMARQSESSMAEYKDSLKKSRAEQSTSETTVMPSEATPTEDQSSQYQAELPTELDQNLTEPPTELAQTSPTVSNNEPNVPEALSEAQRKQLIELADCKAKVRNEIAKKNPNVPDNMIIEYTQSIIDAQNRECTVLDDFAD